MLGIQMANPRARIAKAKAGAKRHEPGKKLYINQLVHGGQDFFAKYPGKAVTSSDGASSARWEALQHPQRFLSPEALAAHLDYTKSELINRPGIGLSELSGALMNFNDMLVQGASAKVFHPELSARWSAIWESLNLQSACEVLNDHDYPTADRSSAKIKASVKSICKLGQTLREHWNDWASVFGFMACGTLDLTWLLTLGSLTCAGVWAERMDQVPMAAGDAKATLMNDKQSGLSLIAFLVAEAHAVHGVRLCPDTPAPAASAVFVPVKFDSDDDQVTEQPATSKQTLLEEKRDYLWQTVVPRTKRQEKIRQFYDAFVSEVEAFYAEVNEFGAQDAIAASSLVMPEFRAHVKRIKREAKHKLGDDC
ncbi:unnamed protein product [Prorocentrum cordatum]|uniref:Uncharacterized protein n=1 Tax=Prorocentrum cordatum TaxID=2364126 RepID=A0ABN9SNN5_9DINO|nr:unnamed protein product [Polarella glacialis]